MIEKIYPNIWKIVLGTPEVITPHSLLNDDGRSGQLYLEENQIFPYNQQEIIGCERKSGYLVTLPIRNGEKFYGLGLQFQSFSQNGKRKTLRTNADAVADTGDSHAPVPFFVTSGGTGILVDTAKNIEFDFGSSKILAKEQQAQSENQLKGNTNELYKEKQRGGVVSLYIKNIKGVTLYCFNGGSIKHTVELYNLFCGGGCLPPVWGLGNLYRCYTKGDQALTEALLDQFEEENMPISMLGLEPGWQSHSYSCSFRWNETNFPKPEQLMEKAKQNNVKVNLWEQPYVHPEADFYDDILKFSGDYEVWEGAVPDFATKEGAAIYGGRQGKLIEEGMAAVKLDECDGSDYTGGWFFPDYASFPSGLDGEEEKNLYGALAIRAVHEQFIQWNKRTYSQVRANFSYGAKEPFVLYSDLYDHSEFIRALCNAGFSGLLWSPEVRQCSSAYELLRRMQTVVFSPLSLVNAWMIPNPPWKQFDIKKNLDNELLGDHKLQEDIRKLMEVRNQLIPYLYTAFYQYYKYGTPPFRPMVMEFPDEGQLFETDDTYMMGERLLIAPVAADKESRSIYLPKGKWYNFWDNTQWQGGNTYDWNDIQIPVFVRDNTILPLAMDKKAPGEALMFHLQMKIYGDKPEPCILVEDDGYSEDYRKGHQKIYKIEVGNKMLEIPVMSKYEVIETIHIEN